MIILRLNWGWICFQAHSSDCWLDLLPYRLLYWGSGSSWAAGPETSVESLLSSLLTRQLMTWHIVFIRVKKQEGERNRGRKGKRERESVSQRETTVFRNLISSVSSHHFAKFYSLEANHRVQPILSQGHCIYRGVNTWKWRSLGAILEAVYHIACDYT